MKHNEILKALTPTITYSPHLKFGSMPILKALADVVLIHKPTTRHPYPDVCVACGSDYPCLTIYRIEKQLKQNKGKKWLSPLATKLRQKRLK